MLDIDNKYYNSKDIRCLNLSNRDNLVITFINGDVENTDSYCNDYRFKQILEQWKKELEDK